MALTFSGWYTFSDDKKKLKSGQEPLRGSGYTMYHGTHKNSARAIVTSGFRPSAGGNLGAGVYCSRNKAKAMAYPLTCNDDADRVVFILKVRVGKVKKIDGLGAPLQISWQQNGYDTAWLPATNGRLEEDCVWDPKRITIVGIAHCVDVQLMADLQKEIKKSSSTQSNKDTCKICKQVTKIPHCTVKCWSCGAAICPFANQHLCQKKK